jgi:hypothetical protein
MGDENLVYNPDGFYLDMELDNLTLPNTLKYIKAKGEKRWHY